jgi:uncharacterized protein (TIGR03083 family)
MLWSDTCRLYLESVAALEPLVADIEDPAAPGLGVWDVRGLAGHLLRALRTPLVYLAEPAPEAGSVTILDAAGYYSAYLDWRTADPDAGDDAIATRGSFELQGADSFEIAEAFRTATRDLRTALSATEGSRVIATPNGAVQIDEYLRTRIVEVITHGMDLARATDRGWSPPAAAVVVALSTLAAVSVDRNQGFDLLAVLTGRDPDHPPLPVLR